MNNPINEKILVCYLITKFDDENTLLNFLKNYNNFKSGHTHELLICYKLFNKSKLEIFRKLLTNINHTEFIDENVYNDFDLGSYSRVALKYSSRHIFFLNSYSYPICDNWLKILIKNYSENSILATSASYESLLSSIKLKKFYKVFHYLIKLIQYKKFFYPFPNPHIRTTGFLIKGSEYLKFINNKLIKSKIDVWKIESGKHSLTNYFKNLNYNIFIINSDGKKFLENDWKLSKTYNYSDQNKSIISDRHIRKYHNLNTAEKLKFQINTWGSN